MSVMFLTTPIKEAYSKMSDQIEPVFPHAPIKYTDTASKHWVIDGLSFLDLGSIANYAYSNLRTFSNNITTQ